MEIEFGIQKALNHGDRYYLGGPAIDDQRILRKLPGDLAKLLKSVNGFVQLDGALHVRGACQTPSGIRCGHAWESTMRSVAIIEQSSSRTFRLLKARWATSTSSVTTMFID